MVVSWCVYISESNDLQFVTVICISYSYCIQ